MGGAPSRVLDSPALYLGGADVLKDESFFTSNGITAILSVGDETPPAEWGHIKECLHINKRDNPDTSLEEHFAEVVAFVHGARCAQRAVYIHCHAGISRSSTCCAAYLMAHLSMPLLDVMGHLLRCRDTVCPNPGFREQLGRFEVDAVAGLCASLRAQHGEALVRSDLEQVARLLVQSRHAVESQQASEWVYTTSGKPVDAETLRTLTDDGDGNGPCNSPELEAMHWPCPHGMFACANVSPVRAPVCKDVCVQEPDDDPKSRGRRRGVLRSAELLAQAEDDWRDGFDVPLDCLGFEAQVERLRARLQPLVEAGEAVPGGEAGLEWLATCVVDNRLRGAGTSGGQAPDERTESK